MYSSAPWLPRWAPSPKKEAAINIAIALFAVAWALKSPYANFQPVITATAVFIFRMVVKLGRYASSSAAATREEQSAASTKRLGRGFILVLGFLLAALVLVKWMPNALAEYGAIALPRWYMLNVKLLTNVVPTLFMGIAATLFR